jgi:hypothetical protein
MFRFSLRTLPVAAMLVAVATGCRPESRRVYNRIEQGVEDVDKHAKDIEKASEMPSTKEPSP